MMKAKTPRTVSVYDKYEGETEVDQYQTTRVSG